MTRQEELACEIWLARYNKWRSNPGRKMHELPPKPPGYDLWLQGGNPLDLNIEQATPTSLTPKDWTSSAKPIPLPGESFIQPPLI